MPYKAKDRILSRCRMIILDDDGDDDDESNAGQSRGVVILGPSKAQSVFQPS